MEVLPVRAHIYHMCRPDVTSILIISYSTTCILILNDDVWTSAIVPFQKRTGCNLKYINFHELIVLCARVLYCINIGAICLRMRAIVKSGKGFIAKIMYFVAVILGFSLCFLHKACFTARMAALHVKKWQKDRPFLSLRPTSIRFLLFLVAKQSYVEHAS